MSIIQIREAKREGARLVIALAGWSGDGKTVTALHLAYGLANYDAGKVGFLDAENRRGSLNADVLKHSTRPTDKPFLIGDLIAPFTPERYIEAIEEFQKAGVEVLIVDSSSHEWEGIGGCIDIANAGNPRMPNWQTAKARHKKFMNFLLQTDMHIIVCVRAREQDKPEKVDGATVFVKYGLQPIQEKNFMFEMTASLMMHEQGMRQSVLKCPGDLQAILGRGEGYITADDGKAVRDWVDGAQQVNPKVEKWRNGLISKTQEGLAVVNGFIDQAPPHIREALGEAFFDGLRKSAMAHDEQASLERGSGDTAGDSSGTLAALASVVASTPAPAKPAAATPAPPAPAPAPVQAATPPAPVPAPPPPPAAVAKAPEADPVDLF
jgi:hypothetical protein